jgi:uncharacterized protein YigA (DUF484 family)
MTTKPARGFVPALAEEDALANYLQEHPDFFERHQHVLAKLVLPHQRGGSAVSLVERQVEVLREKNAKIEEKLAEFVAVARANDQLAERFQRVTRRLMRAASRAQLFSEIERSLRADLDASNSRMLLVGFDASIASGQERFLRVVDVNDTTFKTFDTLFASGKPRCGQLRDSQRDYLFGDEAGQIASVALVPLGDRGSLGLLAIGSSDRNRFHPGMSTEFLGRLSELIADAIQRY